ncbi:hypothetical protein BMS3Abin15_00349 [bacterium BMS3Abin15]|nr:hypothetical protein BMS3Abin15_00349 [bacterium BMS3Abin15]
MKTFLILIIGIVIGAGVVWYWVRKRKCGMSEQEQIKQERKEKILLALRNSKGNKIANNDVEKLVGVSDTTAERYLDELEKEGKIRQVGKTGKFVYYEKI